MNETAVKVGDRAPNFTLRNQQGEAISLESFLGQKPVVLYFYPKDDTPGCTAESCGFRDRYQQFTDLGAEVIGISSDSPDSHKRFANKYNLPFILLSDPGSQVRSQYGVPPTFFLIPGRVTYIIDQAGIVRHIFDSQFDVNAHIQEALTVLKTLSE